MSQISINTSQNVNINFTIASVGERMLAFIIDLLVKGAYLFVAFYILFGFLNFDQFLYGLDYWSAVAVYIIITFPITIYPLVLESLMEGQTLGKKVMKIKVVKISSNL